MQLDEAIERFDLLAPEHLQDPYEDLKALQESAPIYWSERHNAWILTRFEDVSAAYFNPSLSSDRIRPLLDAATGEFRAEPVLHMMADWMVVADPPQHTRLRRLIAPAFRPDRVARLAADIELLVDRFLDAFVEEGHEDYVAGVAFPLPATVIATILGAPPIDSTLFREWSSDLSLVAFGTGGEGREDRHSRAQKGLEGMLDYFAGLIDSARRHPSENLLSALVHGDSNEEDQLSDEEIAGVCALLLFAGHETTTNLIGSGVALLLQHPEQLRKLKSDAALYKGAVEEVLRFEGPIKFVQRWVVDDVELCGQRVEKGQRVFLHQGAANRDPRQFLGPDEFEITRAKNAHIAFGKGIHTCIGAQLSRIEARIAFQRTFERLPGLRLVDEELHWLPSLASRGLVDLRLAHDARD